MFVHRSMIYAAAVFSRVIAVIIEVIFPTTNVSITDGHHLEDYCRRRTEPNQAKTSRALFLYNNHDVPIVFLVGDDTPRRMRNTNRFVPILIEEKYG